MRSIIKYNNRKLYDKTTKSYTTLEKLRGLIQIGEEVEVIEKKTGSNITTKVLFQALNFNDFTKTELINLMKGSTNEKTNSFNAQFSFYGLY